MTTTPRPRAAPTTPRPRTRENPQTRRTENEVVALVDQLADSVRSPSATRPTTSGPIGTADDSCRRDSTGLHRRAAGGVAAGVAEAAGDVPPDAHGLPRGHRLRHA